ncbi:MAG: Gfo/Idh/MocA family oxidoreductase [Actinomycetota bacterium]|nr:Gfo/Idh/MocA family oxidoreductase [Actinomycetota bacterium]
MLFADGPRRTGIKVRNKLEQRRHLGDYRATLVLGRRHHDGAAVVALAPQAPASADWFLVPEDLVVVVGDATHRSHLVAAAPHLQRSAPGMDGLTNERFLYSGNRPPQPVIDALRRAAAETCPPAAPCAEGTPLEAVPPTLVRVRRSPKGAKERTPLALLGCGDYASTETLPPLLRDGRFTPWVVADREPHVASAKAARHGFAYATTDAEEAIEALPRPGVVMVATAHDAHARLGARAVAAEHTVFVEKPPIVDERDLDDLLAAWRAAPGRIEVGYNRRFAPATAALAEALGRLDGPMTITTNLNESLLAPHHWYYWPNQGTRIAGNVCHWLDIATHLLPPPVLPVEVSVSCALPHDAGEDRTMTDKTICVSYDDGSLNSIIATARGDATLGIQERIEVRRAASTFEIDDFRTVRELSRGRRRVVARSAFRDKGHTAMYRAFAEDVAAGRGTRYPLRDLITVSVVQLAAAELVRAGGGQTAVREQVEHRLSESMTTI